VLQVGASFIHKAAAIGGGMFDRRQVFTAGFGQH